MIHIILLILKIIGITLLSIVALVLLVLALVLFVPVLYRMRIVRTKEELRVKGRVSFLFPLLSVHFGYFDKASVKGRIFGIPFWNSEKPKKEKNSDIRISIRQ